MEALSLLKYWKNSSHTKRSVSASTGELYVAAQTGEDQVHLNDDEGPFFDFEFAVPLEEEGEEEEEERDIDDTDSIAAEAEAVEAEMDSTETETEREMFNLTTDDDNNDLFFKGTLVPLTDDDDRQQPINPKSPQVPVSFLKSARKFRVFTLGLRRQKPSSVSSTEKPNNASPSSSPMKQSNNGGKSFTLKLKVEEVPIVSLLTRENSSNTNKSTKKQSSEETETAEEKRLAKDALLQKYLKMIKPLYVKVSKRNIDKKFGLSGQLSSFGLMGNKSSSEPIKLPTTQDHQSSPTVKKIEETHEGINIKSPKQGNLQASLRVVCKHLGKSRSASSSAVAAAPTQVFVTRRHDDSLLQQEDGIQSAILHCKKSLNCDASNRDSPQLLRSTSDPSQKILDDAKGVDSMVKNGR